MVKMFVALSALLVVAAPASADMACAERTDLLSQLGGQYKEAPVAMGLANTGGVVEVLSSPDGNTWTIIVTDTQGLSCLMAAGEFWEPSTDGKKAGQGI